VHVYIVAFARACARVNVYDGVGFRWDDCDEEGFRVACKRHPFSPISYRN